MKTNLPTSDCKACAEHTPPAPRCWGSRAMMPLAAPACWHRQQQGRIGKLSCPRVTLKAVGFDCGLRADAIFLAYGFLLLVPSEKLQVTCTSCVVKRPETLNLQIVAIQLHFNILSQTATCLMQRDLQRHLNTKFFSSFFLKRESWHIIVVRNDFLFCFSTYLSNYSWRHKDESELNSRFSFSNQYFSGSQRIFSPGF